MGELIVCKRDAFAFLTRRGSDRFRDIPKLNPRLVPNPFLLQDEAYSSARSNVSSEGSVSQGSSQRSFQGSTQKFPQGVLKSDSTSSEERASKSGGNVAERSGWRSRDQPSETAEAKQVKLGVETGEKKGAHNRTLRRKFVLERWPTCDPHLLTKTDSDKEISKANGAQGPFESSTMTIEGSPDANPIGFEPTLPKLKTNSDKGELIPGSAADGGAGFDYEEFFEGKARDSARAAALPRNSSWGALPAGAGAAQVMPRARSSALLAHEAEGLVPTEVEDMLAELELCGRNGFGSQVSLIGFEGDTEAATQLQGGKEGVSEDRTGFQGEAGKISSGLGGTESAGGTAPGDVVGDLRGLLGGPENRASGMVEENRIAQSGIRSNQDSKEELGLTKESRGQGLGIEVVTTSAPEESGASETEVASGGRNRVAETEPVAITFEEWQRLDSILGDSDGELETKEDCMVCTGPSGNGKQQGNGTGVNGAARNTNSEQGIGKVAEESGTSENDDGVKQKSKGLKGEIGGDLKYGTVYEGGGIRAEGNGNGKRNGDGMGQQASAGKGASETGGQGERSGMTETEVEARKGNGNEKQIREVNGDQESRGMIEQDGKQETEPDGRNNQTEGRMITKISKSGGQSVLVSKEISLGGFITDEGSSEAKANESPKRPMASGCDEKSVSNASAIDAVKERQSVAASLRTENAGESTTEKGAVQKGVTGRRDGSQSGKSTAEPRSGAGIAGGVKTGGKGGKAMRSSSVKKRGAVAAGGVNAGGQHGRGVGRAGAASGKEGREITKVIETDLDQIFRNRILAQGCLSGPVRPAPSAVRLHSAAVMGERERKQGLVRMTPSEIPLWAKAGGDEKRGPLRQSPSAVRLRAEPEGQERDEERGPVRPGPSAIPLYAAAGGKEDKEKQGPNGKGLSGDAQSEGLRVRQNEGLGAWGNSSEENTSVGDSSDSWESCLEWGLEVDQTVTKASFQTIEGVNGEGFRVWENALGERSPSEASPLGIGRVDGRMTVKNPGLRTIEAVNWRVEELSVAAKVSLFESMVKQPIKAPNRLPVEPSAVLPTRSGLGTPSDATVKGKVNRVGLTYEPTTKTEVEPLLSPLVTSAVKRPANLTEEATQALEERTEQNGTAAEGGRKKEWDTSFGKTWVVGRSLRTLAVNPTQRELALLARAPRQVAFMEALFPKRLAPAEGRKSAGLMLRRAFAIGATGLWKRRRVSVGKRLKKRGSNDSSSGKDLKVSVVGTGAIGRFRVRAGLVNTNTELNEETTPTVIERKRPAESLRGLWRKLGSEKFGGNFKAVAGPMIRDFERLGSFGHVPNSGGGPVTLTRCYLRRQWEGKEAKTGPPVYHFGHSPGEKSMLEAVPVAESGGKSFRILGRLNKEPKWRAKSRNTQQVIAELEGTPEKEEFILYNLGLKTTPAGGSHSRAPSISGSVDFGFDTPSDERTEIMHFSSEGGKLVMLLPNDVARKCSTPLLSKWRFPEPCSCAGWDEHCSVVALGGTKPKGRENDELAGADGAGALRMTAQVDGSPTVILMMQSGRDLFVLEHHPQLKAVQAFGAAVSILETLRK